MNRLIATCVLVAALAACKPTQNGALPPDNAAAPARPPSQQPAAPAVKANPATPSLRVTTLDGAHYDLAAHRGKWVVVNFWATWCTPCLKEMPELSALDAMREHIEVIGLAYDDIQPAELKVFLQKHPVVYPIAIIDTYSPPADFATPRGLPTTYLIAPDGKVAKQFLGPVTARDVEAAIAAAGGPKAS
jgi:thiol-disulfide isomerase/thioredoxin